jgi:mono/diheme cytochrome c family protein
LRRALLALLVLGAAGAFAFYLVTMPVTVPASALPAHTPDLANGKYMFAAGGCAECHAVPREGCNDLKIRQAEILAGGRCLKTPFGTFNVPNISPDKATGIGNWTTLDFVNAMKHGVAPDGTYLYPAFPYPSYQRMTYEDLIDLKSYLDTLPAVSNKVPPPKLRFPYNIRRALGLWDRVYVDGKSFTPDPNASAKINRGAYLVRGPAHCSECHSSRNLLGGIVKGAGFAGTTGLEGKGHVPNITPSEDGIGDWTEEDIAYLLETGTKPDYDTIGEAMAPVQKNMAKLTPADREAIAAYIKSLPPGPDADPEPKKSAGEDHGGAEKGNND